MLERAEADPQMVGSMDDPANRAYIFASGVIGLGIDYREEFQRVELTSAESRALYLDANNIFVAGLLRTGRGTCVSMPMLYLLIGQRADFPVHFVTVGKHCFIRWEEPGYRMNFETTIVQSVSMTPDDDVYLESEGLTRQDIAGTNALRNFTPREVIGALFFTRACHLFVHGPEHMDAIARDGHRAVRLIPDSGNVRAFHSNTLARQQEIQHRQAMAATNIATVSRALANPRTSPILTGAPLAVPVPDPLRGIQAGLPTVPLPQSPTPGRNAP